MVIILFQEHNTDMSRVNLQSDSTKKTSPASWHEFSSQSIYIYLL